MKCNLPRMRLESRQIKRYLRRRKDQYDIRTIHDLLVHKAVSTTKIYTHVLNKEEQGARSLVDGL